MCAVTKTGLPTETDAGIEFDGSKGSGLASSRCPLIVDRSPGVALSLHLGNSLEYPRFPDVPFELRENRLQIRILRKILHRKRPIRLGHLTPLPELMFVRIYECCIRRGIDHFLGKFGVRFLALDDIRSYALGYFA